MVRVTLKLEQMMPDSVQHVLMDCPVSSNENMQLCSSRMPGSLQHGASAGCYGDILLASARWPGYTGVNGLNIPFSF